MAFPGELNINYYKGDTYEFKIYPQQNDGSIFSLSSYSNATFKIAETRGSAGVSGQISGSAQILGGGTYVLCAITPENGALMDPTKTYEYDVQVYSAGSGTYDKIFTLLTGSISITDDVTQGSGENNNTIQTYQVFYNNNGATSGTTPVDTNNYVPNQNIVIKNQGTLARVGYSFVGWTDNPSGSGSVYIAGDSHPLMNSDITFYPKWVIA
jgi:hypothetical protein